MGKISSLWLYGKFLKENIMKMFYQNTMHSFCIQLQGSTGMKRKGFGFGCDSDTSSELERVVGGCEIVEFDNERVANLLLVKVACSNLTVGVLMYKVFHLNSWFWC